MDCWRHRYGGRVALAAVILFTLFLASSAPHRVHHLFDPESATACVTFVLSKGCDLHSSAVSDVLLIQLPEREIVFAFELRLPQQTLSPFRQRSPPQP
jgi:hypothetical protein